MPESHAGRLLDHVHLRVHDVEASKRFYAAALEPMVSVSRSRVMAGSRSTSSS
jgi:catechol-2,3-dioxygenase